jgi:hypothetical protein
MEEVECLELTLDLADERDASRFRQGQRNGSRVASIKISGPRGAAQDFTCWSVRPNKEGGIRRPSAA